MYRYSSVPRFSNGMLIFSLAVLLFMLIAMWRVYTKAGEKGWKCLIPIYGTYVYWRIGWTGEKFLVIFFGGLGIGLLNLILGYLGRVGAVIAAIVAAVWAVYVIYLSFKMAITMAHRFGKSTAFGVLGLVFFAIIGIPILAFGSADYDESRDMG